MTRDEIWDVIDDIKYKDYWIPQVSIIPLDWPVARFRWQYKRRDAITGKERWSFSGPTYFPVEDLTGPEHVIRIMFAAALRCEEHECREFFTWRGERVFNPHKSLIREITPKRG